MTMDPISDMLTTIRNGQKARLHSVSTPASGLKGEIARVMKEAGYIADAVTTTEFPKKLVITLKYSDKAVRVFATMLPSARYPPSSTAWVS